MVADWLPGDRPARRGPVPHRRESTTFPGRVLPNRVAWNRIRRIVAATYRRSEPRPAGG